MASLPIFLDCDPGHDDALDSVLGLARPGLRLVAVTTVAGDAPLDHTTRDGRRVLTPLGRTDVPVAAGADRPILREPWVPVEFHGAFGIDGADLPELVISERLPDVVDTSDGGLRGRTAVEPGRPGGTAADARIEVGRSIGR